MLIDSILGTNISRVIFIFLTLIIHSCCFRHKCEMNKTESIRQFYFLKLITNYLNLTDK